MREAPWTAAVLPQDQEERVEGLLDTLKQCVERLDRYRRLGQRVGESNTKAGLIEPVIAALGWEVLDPDEVHREYRRRPADNPVDYALLLSRTPRLFIEAKGLGENIDDPKWANQTISYAALAGVEWVALTDGAEWRLYNAHAPVPVEQKLFRAVRVTDDVEAAFELLALLSKDNLRDNRLQELWRGFFVDRQVKGALAELFNAGEPARDLVALVAKRAPGLTRGDIRASLARARAAFDFPTLSLPTAPVPPATSPPARVADDSARANRCEAAAGGWLDAGQRGRAARHVAGRDGERPAPGGVSDRSRLPGPTPHRGAARRWADSTGGRNVWVAVQRRRSGQASGSRPWYPAVGPRDGRVAVLAGNGRQSP
jgi:hypothetical protein